MAYESQLAFKNQKVKNNLMRLGNVPEELQDEIMEPICGMSVNEGEIGPFRYRNKAQFPIRTDKEGKIVTGFYAGRTHQIIPCEDCALGVDVNKDILKIIIDFMNEY